MGSIFEPSDFILQLGGESENFETFAMIDLGSTKEHTRKDVTVIVT